MFVRVPEQPPEVWQRFRVPDEGFEFSDGAGLYRARIVAGAERSLGLFLALTARLSPRVRLRLQDVRQAPDDGGRGESDEAGVAAVTTSWHGDDLDREQVRLAVEGARAVLAREGGVEVSVFDDEDQVTLSPNLDLFVFARTARWYPLLRGLGLRRYPGIPHRSWRLLPGEFPPSEAIRKTLRDIVRRFGAEPV
jgi:hypothetical protein